MLGPKLTIINFHCIEQINKNKTTKQVISLIILSVHQHLSINSYTQAMYQHPNHKLHSYQSQSVENNRLAMLQQQEQMTYKAFQLQNFYQNKKLNLVSLKDRIQKFKASKVNSIKNGLNLSYNNPLNVSDNHLSHNLHHPIDNINNSNLNQQQNRQSIPSSNTKLQRIIVPQSQQEKREMMTQKLNQSKDFQYHLSNQLKTNYPNNHRDKLSSHIIKDLKSGYGQQNANEKYLVRQNVIKSNFDKYQTLHNQNPQHSAHQKHISMKREKTQQNLRKSRNSFNRGARYDQPNNNMQKLPPKSTQFKIQPITTVGTREARYSNKAKTNNQRIRSTEKSFIQSQKESRVSLTLNSLNKKIPISSQYQLDKLESLMSRLWSLYETLTRIMQHAIDEPFNEEQEIQKYVQEVCGEGFEQIGEILETVNCKRLIKAVKLAKMLENLSVVYLFLEETKKKKSDKTHIVNFIGYCSSNVIFLIRILYLVHDVELENSSKGRKNEEKFNVVDQVNGRQENNRSGSNDRIGKLQSINYKQLINLRQQPQQQSSTQPFSSQQAYCFQHATFSPPKFSYSTYTQSILGTILKFEQQSYKQQLTSLLDIIIRMEHNNETINIIQVKFCSQNDKYFQTIVTEFLKKALRDNDQEERLCYYARYIFEFLAFHIAKFKLYGFLPTLQVAPQPYLSLKFPHTIVIQPYQVLVYQNKLNILIRAYAQTFIQTLSSHCNIVFWTDQMPQDIEPILTLFPKKQNIYTLYRYHCVYDKHLQTYVKPLERLGGKLENTIVIDRAVENFGQHRAAGIELRWIGEKKDAKLNRLLSVLQPMVMKDSPLRKSLVDEKQYISQVLGKKKKGFLNRKQFKGINDTQSNFNEDQSILENHIPSEDVKEETEILKEMNEINEMNEKTEMNKINEANQEINMINESEVLDHQLAEV